MSKRQKTLQQTVKETVDAVYHYLAPHPDGITMKANEFGNKGSRICTKLVNRGIISKQALGLHEFKYKWIAAMAPTNVLYGSISDEIRTEDRRYQETFNKRAKSTKPSLAKAGDMLEIPIPPVPVIPEVKDPVDEVREMWEKMKQMGVSIQNNQLVFTEIRTTVIS